MKTNVIYEFQGEPVIKVQVASCSDHIDFKTLGRFSIIAADGRKIFDNIPNNRNWRIKLETFEPAQYAYSILFSIHKDRKKAEKVMRSLQEKGLEPRLQALGGIVKLNDQTLTNNTQYRVLLNEYNSDVDARTHGWHILNQYQAQVVKEKIRSATGRMELFDGEYEKTAKINNAFKLVPGDAKTETILYDIIVGQGYDWESRRQRHLIGSVDFFVGDHGGLSATMEIPLERYLKGVLPVEMGGEYPIEALKSQAITSRGWVLANLGLGHPNEPFDICSESHCQKFGGLTPPHPDIEKAVNETRGILIFCDKTICETPYSPNCGGHTDDLNLWGENKKAPHIKGHPDVQETFKTQTLRSEKNVSNWVHHQPNVICNPNGHEHLPLNDHTKDAFRWEVSYSRKQLEEIIQEKTGEDVGTVYDIIPISRGSSGRLSEIEILGSRKNLRIKPELRIRQALSHNTLKSSCFVIESQMGDNGIPISFSFIGAGCGHGIGMCQFGATMMALKGKTYEEILNHYFKKITLTQVYS